MLTTRWHSMPEMNRLHDEMNRLFDRWGTNGGRAFSRTEYPPLNLWEDDDKYFVEAELPGFELSDLEIYVTGDNHLSINGERKQPEKDGGRWHRQERGFGKFSRVIELPGGVSSDDVSAEFKNGVLTITLAKREEVKPRRIEVKSI